MPASRAASIGFPFFTPPERTSARAVRLTRTWPRAVASRFVTGFPPTSTIRIDPSGATCVKAEPTAVRMAWSDRGAGRDSELVRLGGIILSLSAREKE
jgi:hypothetical protein